MHFLMASLMLIISVFLILLVLVQRGRGGGLTGALGGMGGQSAFGTKAGDVFTRITMVTAVVWILVCMLTIKVLQDDGPLGNETTTTSIESTAPLDDKGTGATDGAADKTSDKAGGGLTPESPAKKDTTEKADK
jgi:preprotein translocase subunit SecG